MGHPSWRGDGCRGDCGGGCDGTKAAGDVEPEARCGCECAPPREVVKVQHYLPEIDLRIRMEA